MPKKYTIKFEKLAVDEPLSRDNFVSILMVDEEGNGFQLGSVQVINVFKSEKEITEGIKQLDSVLLKIKKQIEIDV